MEAQARRGVRSGALAARARWWWSLAQRREGFKSTRRASMSADQWMTVADQWQKSKFGWREGASSVVALLTSL